VGTLSEPKTLANKSLKIKELFVMHQFCLNYCSSFRHSGTMMWQAVKDPPRCSCFVWVSRGNRTNPDRNFEDQSCFATAWSGKRASLWNGSAASWISLHDLLPTDFDYSVATGIASDGSHIYIFGLGT
jgi:hypothetical protein